MLRRFSRLLGLQRISTIKSSLRVFKQRKATKPLELSVQTSSPFTSSQQLDNNSNSPRNQSLDSTSHELDAPLPTFIAIATPDQKILLFDMPHEILLVICRLLCVKSSPIGSVDSAGEVIDTRFMTDYRKFRTSNFELVNQFARRLITPVFFGYNTFEFHHAVDFERFGLSISDYQRPNVRRIRFFSATTRPYSQRYQITADPLAANGGGARHFAVLSDDELAAAAKCFQNGLTMLKTCNRLQSLEIYYRYQIHAESLNRPHSNSWEGDWARHLLLPSTPPCTEQIARWDYVHTGSLERLRGAILAGNIGKTGAGNCFDFDEPIANELADRIDHFIAESDIEVETYQVEPDCNEILSEVEKARDQIEVRSKEGKLVCQVLELKCICCFAKVWKKREQSEDQAQDTIRTYCANCEDRGCQHPVQTWEQYDALCEHRVQTLVNRFHAVNKEREKIQRPGRVLEIDDIDWYDKDDSQDVLHLSSTMRAAWV